MKTKELLKKVRDKIKSLADKGQAYTSLSYVPFGKQLIKQAKKENKIIHERYLFGGLRFVEIE